jgi:uncharacterized membrane protein
VVTVKVGKLVGNCAAGTAFGLGIVVACAASCAVEDKDYRFAEMQGGTSGTAAGSGGAAPASATGGALAGRSTGGVPSGGRGGAASSNATGGAPPSAMAGATQSATGGAAASATGGANSPPNGGTATASGGKSSLPSGGTPSTQSGGASAIGGTAGSSGGKGGSGGGASKSVNECAAAQNPCQNGGECQDTDSGFTCECPARYTGERCENLKFRGMGLLTGATGSSVRAISDDGTVAAGSVTMTNSTTPVRLNLASGGPLQSLGQPANATSCVVTATNADGTWLGGSCLGAQAGGGFMWTPTDGPSLATTSMYKSFSFADATPDGRVRTGTVTAEEGADPQPFRWTASTGFVLLDMPQAGVHYGQYVGANGDVIAGSFVGTLDGVTIGRGFRWTASAGATYVPVPSKFTNKYIIYGMSEDGNVMVGYGTDAQVPHALRWSGASMQLEDLGSGYLLDCSADGQILLGGSETKEILIWESGESRTLLSILGDTPDLAGWTLGDPAGISHDGKVVVGNGTRDGVPEGWIAHLP